MDEHRDANGPVGAQSTLRGPMILAKVITDALKNKNQVGCVYRSTVNKVIYTQIL